MLSQGAVFGTVRTAVRLKSKLQKTVRSRYSMPGSAGSTSFSIPNKCTLTVWGHLDCLSVWFEHEIHTAHQSAWHTRTTGHQHRQRFNSGTQAM